MNVGVLILAVVFASITSALAAVAVPELTQGHGWIVQGLFSLFAAVFYVDAIRYLLDEE
jgi:uncharacterized membrane protein YwaF